MRCHTKVAKWIAAKFQLDLQEYDGQAFMNTCRNGQLKVVKWLVAEYAIDVHVLGESGFIDVHANNEAAFRYACTARQMQVIAWFEQDLSSSMRYFCHNKRRIKKLETL